MVLLPRSTGPLSMTSNLEPQTAIRTASAHLGWVYRSELNPTRRATITGPSTIPGLIMTASGICGLEDGSSMAVLVGFGTTAMIDSYGLPVAGGPNVNDDTLPYKTSGASEVNLGKVNPPNKKPPWVSGLVAGPGITVEDYGTYDYTDPLGGTHPAPGPTDPVVDKPKVEVDLATTADVNTSGLVDTAGDDGNGLSWPGVPVQHAGTAVATEQTLDFEDTDSVTFAVTDDSASGRVKVSATATGGGGGGGGSGCCVCGDGFPPDASTDFETFWNTSGSLDGPYPLIAVAEAAGAYERHYREWNIEWHLDTAWFPAWGLQIRQHGQSDWGPVFGPTTLPGMGGSWGGGPDVDDGTVAFDCVHLATGPSDPLSAEIRLVRASVLFSESISYADLAADPSRWFVYPVALSFSLTAMIVFNTFGFGPCGPAIGSFATQDWSRCIPDPSGVDVTAVTGGPGTQVVSAPGAAPVTPTASALADITGALTAGVYQYFTAWQGPAGAGPLTPATSATADASHTKIDVSMSGATIPPDAAVNGLAIYRQGPGDSQPLLMTTVPAGTSATWTDAGTLPTGPAYAPGAMTRAVTLDLATVGGVNTSGLIDTGGDDESGLMANVDGVTVVIDPITHQLTAPGGGGGGGSTELGYASATAIVTTNSTSWIDVPSMTLTMTMPDGPVDLEFWCALGDFTAGATGLNRFDVQVYDVTASVPVVVGYVFGEDGEGGLVSLRARVDPGAGTRTYKVQVQSESGFTTCRLYADASSPMWFQAINLAGGGALSYVTSTLATDQTNATSTYQDTPVALVLTAGTWLLSGQVHFTVAVDNDVIAVVRNGAGTILCTAEMSQTGGWRGTFPISTVVILTGSDTLTLGFASNGGVTTHILATNINGEGGATSMTALKIA